MANNMNEQHLKEVELSDFPNEILTKIMTFLDDTTLLNMTQVCKRFRAIAKEAFKQKYDGHRDYAYFTLDNGSVDINHWVYTLIQRYCNRLEMVIINGADDIELSKILHPGLKTSLKYLGMESADLVHHEWSICRFENLISLHIQEVGCEQQHLIDFIKENSQLEDIRMNSLCNDSGFENYLPVLKAIENSCKNIRDLGVTQYCNIPLKWDDEMISIVCKLTTLQSLKITAEKLKVNQLETIVRSLPNLSLLVLMQMSAGSKLHDNLGQVISVCRNVSHLKIDLFMANAVTFDFLAHTADVLKSKKTLKLSLSSSRHGKESILIVKGMVRRNNIIVYDKDAVNKQHSKNLLDLNDLCLDKIIGFSCVKGHSALYNTCKRTRTAIETFYAANVIRTPFEEEQLNEDTLRCLGERIQSMELTNFYGYLTQKQHEKMWTSINQYCTNLNELIIITCRYLRVQPNVWPVLKKLILSGEVFYHRHNALSEYSVSYDTLRSFVCPMLTHLEILSFQILDDTVQSLDHGNNFRSLTVLKIGHYNDHVKMFLEALDGNVCEQMTELSIGAHLPMESRDDDDDDDEDFFDGTATESNIELIYIVSRFRKLVSLHLVVRGVDCCDTKYLFENCTKLVTFGVWCWGGCRTEEMFIHIYRNCPQINTIRLFGTGIFRKCLQDLRTMFPEASIDVAIQNNVRFSCSDDNPCYNEMVVTVPGN